MIPKAFGREIFPLSTINGNLSKVAVKCHALALCSIIF